MATWCLVTGFSPDAHDSRLPSVLSGYGAADSGLARRATWYARLAPCHTIVFGLETGDATKAREGAAALVAAPLPSDD